MAEWRNSPSPGIWPVRSVAVLEKGWPVGGNMARNTTIIRSDHRIEAFSHTRWVTLSAEQAHCPF